MQVFIWISNIILLPEVKRIKRPEIKMYYFLIQGFLPAWPVMKKNWEEMWLNIRNWKSIAGEEPIKIMYCLYGRHFHILKWERLLCFIHICVVICERKYWIIPIREIIIKKKQQNRWIHGWMRSGILEITVRIILCWQVWLPQW